jgi:hypothetical protein
LGQHEEHWQQAEKEVYADKPIRGMIVDDATIQIGRSISPLQAVVHAQTGVIQSVGDIVLGAEAGGRMTVEEARDMEEATDAAATGYSGELRRRIKQAIGVDVRG